MDPEAYRQAVNGEGDPQLVLDWKDKPHRLVYDLVSNEKALRELLWLRHGCAGLYGDDGEMQCGVCLIDFRRDSVESIVKRFRDIGLQKLAEALARNDKILEQINNSPRSIKKEAP